MSTSGKSDWWQLHVTCHQTNHVSLDVWLNQLGAAAITLTDAQDEPVYLTQPDQETLWRTLHIRALLATPLSTTQTEALQQYQKDSMILSWRIEPLPEQDWQRQCHTKYQAARHGKRLWTYPHWDLPRAGDAHAVHVHINPGLAFGSGSHPTTALCLTWLDQHIQQQPVLIDYGCGSGILGIAAVKLGVGMVHAIDHDPEALSATQQNAVNNQVSHRLATHHHAPSPGIEANIVMANILANPLIAMVDTLASLTKCGGKCVLSGILTSQIKQLEQYYKKYFTPLSMSRKDDWACWVLLKH